MKKKPKASAATKKPATEKSTSLHLPKGVLLGAHTSISGGVNEAIPRAQNLGFTAAQIFV
jgi:hypothetical protein